MGGYTVFARYYDTLQTVDYREMAQRYDALMRRHRGERRGLLLDLACGTGSLSLEFHRMGYEVIGADASSDMLSEAMGKSAEGGADILFLHQAMEDLDLYGTVETVVCALDSINHLQSRDALRVALEKVALFLAPGGLFLFDVNTLHKHRDVLGDNVFAYEGEDLLCVWRNGYREGDHGVDIALDFFQRQRDGRYTRHTEQFSEQYYSDGLLRELLQATGFSVLGVYSEGGEAPEPDAQRLIYVVEHRHWEKREEKGSNEG